MSSNCGITSLRLPLATRLRAWKQYHMSTPCESTIAMPPPNAETRATKAKTPVNTASMTSAIGSCSG